MSIAETPFEGIKDEKRTKKKKSVCTGWAKRRWKVREHVQDCIAFRLPFVFFFLLLLSGHKKQKKKKEWRLSQATEYQQLKWRVRRSAEATAT